MHARVYTHTDTCRHAELLEFAAELPNVAQSSHAHIWPSKRHKLWAYLVNIHHGIIQAFVGIHVKGGEREPALAHRYMRISTDAFVIVTA